MPTRWTLNRAGILNVYQYGDETLNFAGGRLLLRGVNGSGKSTAMNMLLPFLLDGDTRKIDAAGEQAGVLKSWMLSGRDDAQPVGYLWVEVAKGAEYLTFGCGIKANRSTDSVSTWWWLTPRRPGIDLDLVQDRRPLSAEALRQLLGPEAVFRQEDRRGYREALRQRLYGGADIDQHIRLLHVVRNPRVGDKIEQELASHLHEALPQLSEAALTDAAQPLDDLEEHRRNVEELSRTWTALSGLQEVYADYARTELRRRAVQADEVAGGAERAQREASRARNESQKADQDMQRATRQVAELEADQRRLATELRALREAPAYAEGRQLEDLRARARDLALAMDRAAAHLQGRRSAQSEAASDLAAASARARSDHATLKQVLTDLGQHSLAAGLAAGVPDVPALAAVPLEGAGGLEAPGEPVGEGLDRRLSEVKAAAAHRRGDVEELRRELRQVTAALRRLETAAAAADAAQEALAAAEEAELARTAGLDGTVSAWRLSLAEWCGRLGDMLAAAGVDGLPDLDLHTNLADRHSDVLAAIVAEAERLLAHHQRAVAVMEAAEQARQVELAQVEAEVAALDATVLPEPPFQPWQRPERGPVLGELVDFLDETDARTRAAIEAAMEASGLLTAEIGAGGDLVLPEGTLVAAPAGPVEPSLAHYLCAVDGAVEGVSRVLASISTDPADLGDSGRTVIAPDGRFRVGVLAGRHAKVEAEHIGLAARRARLERQRADARRRLRLAQEVLQQAQQELANARALLQAARSIRETLPSAEPVTRGVLALEMARKEVERARRVFDERDQARRLADEKHAEALDKSRRNAANMGLPAEEEPLARVERAVSLAEQVAQEAAGALRQLTQAWGYWQRAAQHWERACAEVAAAGVAADQARCDHDDVASRLAAIEEKVGTEYREIVAAIEGHESRLAQSTGALREARNTQLACQGKLVDAQRTAEDQAAHAAATEQRCVALVPGLRRALDVPGLLAAASEDISWARSPVEESVAGLRQLAAAILANVPAQATREVTAEGVRQSLRQRRDSLGAGWDAEDRQPDDSLPLMVEINGPQGRFPLADAVKVVSARRGELSALLSSEQDQALRNLLQGLVAREVAEKLNAAEDLVRRMNRRLDSITTAHGIGVSLRWRRRDGLGPELTDMTTLLAKPPDLRTPDEDARLRQAVSAQLGNARRENPESPYTALVGEILDYRSWYEITLLLRRPGRPDERLTRRTALSEGEKKIVSYLPLFAAVAASCDSLAEATPDVPRFLLLDDAFAKVSEDNHPKLFGLLVELDLDFIATSERLWGTHETVPELAITEVVRDASTGVIVLEHSRWESSRLTAVP